MHLIKSLKNFNQNECDDFEQDFQASSRSRTHLVFLVESFQLMNLIYSP